MSNMFFKNVTADNKPFIIAEIGQNHQGDFATALEYVVKFSDAGADAVKFQTRDNKYLFDDLSYNNKYNSENAFAESYGAHRDALELTKGEVRKLRKKCRELGIKFMSTPFDEPSLEFLQEIETDILKVASFDLGNLAFLNKIALTEIPIVMSIGGGQLHHVKDSVDIISSLNKDLAILHCVSEYPCPYDRLGLENIQNLKNQFPDFVVGLSDHFNGTLSGPIGYECGARVFEKHVTLNRAWKGTDHSFALEPRGFESFVRDIHRVPNMKKVKPKNELGSEYVFKKLGKSLAAMNDIKEGQKLTLENIRGKIFFEPGIPVRETALYLNKPIKRDIKAGEKK